MFLQQWMHLRHNIDIPWKMFVRESPNTRDESPEKHIHQLAFQGNEAKAAYEEIIEQSFNSNTMTMRKCLKSKTIGGQSNSSTNSISVNGQPRKTIPEDVLTQVTTNTLLKAVEQKDLKFLQKHMTSENVNVSDDFGWTPLMSAAYCGHLEIVQFLLNLGANKRTRDRSGLTAAQLALKKNYLSIVALLKKKSDLMSGNNQISTNSPKISNTNALSARPKPTDCSMEREKDVCNVLEQKTQFEQNAPFYCEICKTTFQETTLQKHESSTLHIFNTKPKLKHAMYGISRQNKGYRMLLNTGWDEEAGLGPSGKGLKYPIKTCLKMDRKGLGQLVENEYKVTHFKPGDATAINTAKIPKQKTLKKRDREKLLHREARKERALRIALS